MSEPQQDVKQSIESGEYYRDALSWYGTIYHHPISQRALLIILTSFAVAIITMSLMGLFVLLPLSETKPMIVRVPDSLAKVANVTPLTNDPTDDANEVVMEWFIKDFVKVRESYDIDRQQYYFRRMRALSAPDTYRQYLGLFKGPASPTIRYERHTKREIEVKRLQIKDVKTIESASSNRGALLEVSAYVEFVATEVAPDEDRKSAWGADITFRYQQIHVDQVTGELTRYTDSVSSQETPVVFSVTQYDSKQLGLD